MSQIITVNGTRNPRVYRTSQLRVDTDYNTKHVASARMDAGTTNGPYQLEKCDVSLLDARTTRALRVALEASLQAVAKRFNLDAQVVYSVAMHTRAEFRILLRVKPDKS
jgi:hypothetical protein